MRDLRSRLRYVIEDMRLRADSLARARWFSREEMEEQVAQNVPAAAVLRQEALRLERFVKEDEEKETT